MVSRPKPSAPAPARWRYAGLLALALLLPPAAVGNTPAAPREGVWSPVGKDTDGRECSARATRETPPEIPADQAISVACGRLDRAPNQIFVASATNEAVAAGWNRYRERVLNCGPEEPLPFPAAGTQGRIWHCSPVNASWGYVALTVTIGERQYYAIGQGSAQPALLQAIGVASGRLATAPQSTPTRGDSRILYERYMDDGRVYAAAEQYVKSEDAFRRALEIHQQVNGANSPGATEILLPLALILSNQGRMPEAERYFRDADALFRGQPSIAHGVHLAMHHANMHCFASAHSTLAKLETWLRSRLEWQDADPTDPRANADAARTGRRHDALNVQVTLSPTQATLTPAQFDEVLKTLLYLKAELQYRERLENTTRSRAMPTDCPPSPPKAQAQAQPTAGNPKDAAIRARQTLEMLNGMDKTPSEQAIVAFMLRTRSMTYLALDEPEPSPDDIGAAIEDLNQVIRILNKLNMQERPLAVAHLRLGKAYKLRGKTDDALEHFEKGADLLLKHEQFATIDMLEPYIATLYEQSGRAGTDAAGLRQRMLVLQQLLGDGATARSIAAAATRAENRPTDTISEEEEI
ncbi:tetratricopeptide repeat protein [Niveispirillum fermenti]|uniref:tetratricopeptide repeat protein n=1 Tax=Niveispirillum fermenti TaxID=1233113 RepID=UPI003A886330